MGASFMFAALQSVIHSHRTLLSGSLCHSQNICFLKPETLAPGILIVELLVLVSLFLPFADELESDLCHGEMQIFNIAKLSM